MLDQTYGISDSIEKVYGAAIENSKAHLSEYQRQKQMIQDLVSTQEATIERFEEDCQAARREKEGKELALGEAQRKLKDIKEQKEKTADLNEMDLKNMKMNAERFAMERM